MDIKGDRVGRRGRDGQRGRGREGEGEVGARGRWDKKDSVSEKDRGKKWEDCQGVAVGEGG